MSEESASYDQVAMIGKIIKDSDGVISFKCPYCKTTQMVEGTGSFICGTWNCDTLLNIRATKEPDSAAQGVPHGI
jgi:hypothetical protein